MRVDDAHRSGGDAGDLPRGVTQLEDVAREALDGEVLVERADECFLGFSHDAIVRNFGNRPSRRDGHHTRPTSGVQHAMHLVPVDERRPAAAPRGETLGQHRHYGIELAAFERPVRPCAADEIEQLVFGTWPAGDFRRDLLREHIERRVLHDDGVELTAADRSEQRGAFHEVVARHRQQATLGRARNGVTRSTDPLQQRRDAVGRADLADQIDVTDIDAELQRCRGDQRFERAALEAMLRVDARFLGQASVMRGDLLFAEALAQVPGDSLGHPSRIDEDERRPMRADQLRQTVVVLLPHFVGHDRAERRSRYFELEVDGPAMTFVDDGALAARGIGPHQKPCDCFDRPLGRGKPDPLQRPLGKLLQPFERQRQMRSAPRADDRVDFVDDDCADGAEQVTAPLSRKQQIQRLGSRDEDVRRPLENGGAFGLRRIARTDCRRDAGGFDALGFRRADECPDAALRDSCGCPR